MILENDVENEVGNTEQYEKLKSKTIQLVTLFFTYGAPLEPITTEEPIVEHWKYNIEDRREILREKFSKILGLGTGDGERNQTPTNWSLDNFLNNYLISTPCDYKTPDDWTINNLLENNEKSLFHSQFFEDPFEKYGIEEIEEKESAKQSKRWTFKDYREKYRPMVFWEQVNEENIFESRNETHNKKFFSLVNNLDPTDELLSLEVPRSGRRWWNEQWQLPRGPEQANEKLVKVDNIASSLIFMRETIYQAREKMILIQHMRQEFKNQALYKMGYLFAKVDYACKIFSSLAFKSYRACSMLRQRTYGTYRLFHHFIDIAYNIERLLARWFDVDILKNILVANDHIARKIILKDKNLTTPAMVVQAFNEMFVD